MRLNVFSLSEEGLGYWRDYFGGCCSVCLTPVDGDSPHMALQGSQGLAFLKSQGQASLVGLMCTFVRGVWYVVQKDTICETRFTQQV